HGVRRSPFGSQLRSVAGDYVPGRASRLAAVQLRQLVPLLNLEYAGFGNRFQNFAFPFAYELAGAEYQCPIGPSSSMGVDGCHAHQGFSRTALCDEQDRLLPPECLGSSCNDMRLSLERLA